MSHCHLGAHAASVTNLSLELLRRHTRHVAERLVAVRHIGKFGLVAVVASQYIVMVVRLERKRNRSAMTVIVLRQTGPGRAPLQ